MYSWCVVWSDSGWIPRHATNLLVLVLVVVVVERVIGCTQQTVWRIETDGCDQRRLQWRCRHCHLCLP
jgi:hypothetical protein